MWWFNEICAVGLRKPLEVNDLYYLNDSETSAVLVPRWNKLWEKAMQGIFSSLLFLRDKIYASLVCVSEFNDRKSRLSVFGVDMNGEINSSDETPLLSSAGNTVF